MTKFCYKCKTEKLIEFFNKNTSKKDGLSSSCKKCSIVEQRNYQSKPVQKKLHLERVKNYKIKNKAAIKDFLNTLKSKPCTDCKQTFNPICMDFDHLPQFNKNMAISKMANHCFSTDKILKEIAKCELVCANCHRLRTERRLVEK